MNDIQKSSQNQPDSQSSRLLSAFDKLLQKYTFDEMFLTKSERVLFSLQENAKGILLHALGLGQQLGKSARIHQTAGKISIVFSAKTLKKIRAKEYRLPLDKSTGLFRLDARNARGQIKEVGKVRLNKDVATQLRGAIVSVAHFISAIDTQIQLESISKKLDDIFGFMEAERMGKLRGLYNHLKTVLAIEDERVRTQEVRAIIRELCILEARFYETGLKTIKGVKDPSEISWAESIYTLDSKVERKLKADIAKAHSDIRAADFCNFLAHNMHAIIGDTGSLKNVGEILRSRYETIRPLFEEKIGYIDPRNAKAFSAKAAYISKIATDSDVNVIDLKTKG